MRLEAELERMRRQNARLARVPGGMARLMEFGPGDFELARQRPSSRDTAVLERALRDLGTSAAGPAGPLQDRLSDHPGSPVHFSPMLAEPRPKGTENAVETKRINGPCVGMTTEEAALRGNYVLRSGSHKPHLDHLVAPGKEERKAAAGKDEGQEAT